MNRQIKLLSLVFSLLFFWNCSSIQTNDVFYQPIVYDLREAKYQDAEVKVEQAEESDEYSDKDRLLLLLDKGIILHYNGKFKESNKYFEEAEQLMQELYTKSISKGIGSFLLNDNVLDYSGEVYEDLYINIFKSLNYIHLNDFDGAYVEVNRISNKLKYYRTVYEDMTSEINDDEKNNVKIDPEELDYLNNVLANYISYIIYRAEGEYDNSRISYEKMIDAWKTYPDVYNFHKPGAIKNPSPGKGSFLNIISFTGMAPEKKAVGARITTFDDALVISDPTNYYVSAIFFPGIGYGYNFKFEFPEMIEEGTAVSKIILKVNGEKRQSLDLLENMNSVAIKTFETNKRIIFFKTIARAVAKGIGAGAIGEKLRENNEGFLGDLLSALTNAAFDATEHADTRSWKTMPGYCNIGEVELDPGSYQIEIEYRDRNNNLIQRDTYDNFEIKKGMNLIESFCLL